MKVSGCRFIKALDDGTANAKSKRQDPVTLETPETPETLEMLEMLEMVRKMTSSAAEQTLVSRLVRLQPFLADEDV
jgi:hypothetical protein